MARRAEVFSVFSKGVVDPALSERADLVHLYTSLAEGEGLTFPPQGGFVSRGGTLLASDSDVLAASIPGRLRRRLEPVQVTAAMLTAANGGDKAALVDQNLTTVMTTGFTGASQFTIVEVDFGTARSVAAVDVEGFYSSTVGVNESLAVEYWTGSAWLPMPGSLDNASRKHIRATAGAARSRRFAGWPGQNVSARQWRLSAYGSVGAGTLSVAELRFWAESPAPTAVRLFTLARDVSTSYVLALTDRNVDVFRSGRYQASIAVDIDTAQIPEISAKGSLDTILLLHQDVPTQRLVRQGSDGEWNGGVLPMSNVPTVREGTVFTGDRDEIQILDVTGIVIGDVVSVMLGRLLCAPITYTSDVNFASSLRTALINLAGVDADGLTVTVVSTRRFRVHFINDNGSRAWPSLSAFVAGKAVVPVVTIEQRGFDADEAQGVMGFRTGWPQCAAFVQSRLLLGGFRNAPSTLLFSRAGDFYDFETVSAPMTADLGFMLTIDADQAEEIHEIHVGQDVQVFTSTGEWYLEARSFSATQPPNAVLGTRNGIAAAVPVVFADGTTLFMQRGGETLRDFVFADDRQQYRSDPLNLLAPHLISRTVDIAHQSARSVTSGNSLYLVQDDGRIVHVGLLRSQDVLSMCSWSIAGGAVQSAVSTIDDEVWLAVRRGGDTYLEQLFDLPLDGARRRQGAPTTVVAGLSHLEGQQVWAFADGHMVGPLVVAAGAVTLPSPAADVVVGMQPPFRARGHVVRPRPNEQQPWRPPYRIYTLELAMAETGAISISTNGKLAREVSLLRTDNAFRHGGPLQTPDGGRIDLPLLDRLYTGNRRVEGLTGWTQNPFWEITRPAPVPVHVKSVRVEVAHG